MRVILGLAAAAIVVGLGWWLFTPPKRRALPKSWRWPEEGDD